MAKTSVFYHQTFERINQLKCLFLALVFPLASWPRLLLEVILRKHMGERYYSNATAFTIVLFMALFPFWVSPYGDFTETWPQVLNKHLLWYAYLAVFIYFAIQRTREVRRDPSVFDFEKFSLSTGEVNQFFMDIKINGWQPTIRQIHMFLEPLPFFAGGLLLLFAGQSLGGLLTVCSLFYSASYWAAYTLGDKMVMDLIDKIIFSEEQQKLMVGKMSSDKTRGVQFFGKLPSDMSLSQKLVDNSWIDGDDDSAVVV